MLHDGNDWNKLVVESYGEAISKILSHTMEDIYSSFLQLKKK